MAYGTKAHRAANQRGPKNRMPRNDRFPMSHECATASASVLRVKCSNVLCNGVHRTRPLRFGILDIVAPLEDLALAMLGQDKS